MNKFALNEFGIMGGEYLKETLTSCTDPIKAIEDFQKENGILLPSLSSVLPFLDLHDIPRQEFYESILGELKSVLLNRIHACDIKNSKLNNIYPIVLSKDEKELDITLSPSKNIQSLASHKNLNILTNTPKKHVKKVAFVGGKLKFLKNSKISKINSKDAVKKETPSTIQETESLTSQTKNDIISSSSNEIVSKQGDPGQEVLAALLDKSFAAIHVPCLETIPMAIMDSMVRVPGKYLQKLLLPPSPQEILSSTASFSPPPQATAGVVGKIKLKITKATSKSTKSGRRGKKGKTGPTPGPTTYAASTVLVSGRGSAERPQEDEEQQRDTSLSRAFVHDIAKRGVHPDAPYLRVKSSALKRHVWEAYYPVYARECDVVIKPYLAARSEALLWVGDVFSHSPKARRLSDPHLDRVVELVADLEGGPTTGSGLTGNQLLKTSGPALPTANAALYASFGTLCRNLYSRSRDATYSALFVEVTLSLASHSSEPARKLAWLLDLALTPTEAPPLDQPFSVLGGRGREIAAILAALAPHTSLGSVAFVLADPYVILYLAGQVLDVLERCVTNCSTFRENRDLNLTLTLLALGTGAWNILEEPPTSLGSGLSALIPPDFVGRFIPALMVLLSVDRLNAVANQRRDGIVADDAATAIPTCVPRTLEKFVLQEANALAINLTGHYFIRSFAAARKIIRAGLPKGASAPLVPRQSNHVIVNHVLPIVAKSSPLTSDPYYVHALTSRLVTYFNRTREITTEDGDGHEDHLTRWLGEVRHVIQTFYLANASYDHVMSNALRLLYEIVPDRMHRQRPQVSLENASQEEDDFIVALLKLVDPLPGRNGAHVYETYQRYIVPKLVTYER